MRQKVFSMLALLLMAATGTMAQTEVTQANVKCQQYSYYDAQQGTTNKFSLNSAPPTAVVNITLAEAEAFGAAVSCPTTDWIVVYAKDGDNYKWTSKNKTGEQTSVPGKFGAWTMLILNDVFGCSSDPNSQLTVYISKGLSSVAVTGNSDGTATPTYWSTYYNASQAFTADANTTIYKAKLNGSSLTLTKVTDIAAGQAVILKSTAASITLTAAATTSSDFSDNDLKGGTAVTSGYDAYTLSRGSDSNGPVGFYKFSGGSLDGSKAHLEIPTSAARSFIGIGDGTTAIELPAVAEDEAAEWYSLDGQRLSGKPAHKGIYVKNGQKIIIK